MLARMRQVTLFRMKEVSTSGEELPFISMVLWALARFFQKYNLILDDALPFHPDQCCSASVNDHRARVDFGFQYGQYSVRHFSDGLPEERPLRYLFGRLAFYEYPFAALCLHREILTLETKFIP